MLPHLKILQLSELPSPERCARFILLHLWHRHGEEWLSGPRTSHAAKTGDGQLLEVLRSLGFTLRTKQADRLKGLSSVEELWEHFFFRGIVLDSHEGLLGWMKGHYPLRLRSDIPSPDEMLAIQAQGERYVSLLLKDEQQFETYGRHRDAGDFLLHDFEHAQKFFSLPESFAGQRRFFKKLQASAAEFCPWSSDDKFIVDLNYLKSDMNSHPVHLLKYLKAIVLAAEMRRSGERHPDLEPFWEGLFESWSLSHPVRRSALNMNHPALERVEDQIAVCDFFVQEEKSPA